LKKEKAALQKALQEDTVAEVETMGMFSIVRLVRDIHGVDVEESLMQQYIAELTVERNLLKNIISKEGSVAEPSMIASSALFLPLNLIPSEVAIDCVRF
jgi:hypothetical protein